MNDKVAFTCVAFGQAYVEQQVRLKASILNIYPEANLFFHTDAMPPGSRSFSESMYGFKPHVIEEARQAGFNKVIFFDPAMILQDKVEYWFPMAAEYGILAVQDDSKLTQYISDKCLQYFGVTREWTFDKYLVGGSFYFIDFDTEKGRKIFADWKTAEEKGIFESHLEVINASQGHRNDEAVMSVCLYQNGSKPLPYGGSRYNWDVNPIAIKKHFK